MGKKKSTAWLVALHTNYLTPTVFHTYLSLSFMPATSFRRLIKCGNNPIPWHANDAVLAIISEFDAVVLLDDVAVLYN